MMPVSFKYLVILLFVVCIICPSQGAAALRRGDAGHVRTIRKPAVKGIVDHDHLIREHIRRTLAERDAAQLPHVAGLLKRKTLDIDDLQEALIADLEEALIRYQVTVEATQRELQRMQKALRKMQQV